MEENVKDLVKEKNKRIKEKGFTEENLKKEAMEFIEFFTFLRIKYLEGEKKDFEGSQYCKGVVNGLCFFMNIEDKDWDYPNFWKNIENKINKNLEVN